MQLKIETRKDILHYALLATALAVLVPVAVIATVLTPLRDMSQPLYLSAIFVAGLIPLLITPPVAVLLLHSLLMLRKTIERVDNHVKFDGLTGTLTRNHFLDSVRAARTGGMMLIVDVDHFKAINDELGHDAGDEALTVLASRIATAVGDEGVVGRLGGEEFGVFLPGLQHVEGARMAAAICGQVRKSLVPVGDIRMLVTVSVGGAMHHEHAPMGQSLKLADQRLYQAKREGRNRYIVEEAASVAILAQKQAGLRD